MTILIAFCMSIAVNLDNFVIGMGMASRGKPVPLTANLVISAFTGLFAGIAALCPKLFPQIMVSAANRTGALLIIAFGLYCLLKPSDIPDSETTLPGLSFKGCCALGVTLAVNCIPPSLGAGISGIPAGYMAVFCTLCSLICLHVGSRTGIQLRKSSFIRQVDKLSSLILIGTGILELIL